MEALRPLLPVPSPRGRPPHRCRRTLLNAVRSRIRVGAPWRDLPAAYGPWQSTYGLFRRFEREGVWDRVAGTAAGPRPHHRTRRVGGVGGLHDRACPPPEPAPPAASPETTPWGARAGAGPRRRTRPSRGPVGRRSLAPPGRATLPPVGRPADTGPRGPHGRRISSSPPSPGRFCRRHGPPRTGRPR
ncbi:transposase [Spiractinospora alimapuensis]|uniref:transposase n=1 Tax=Spiractinospora alimapuensis TaxID=2820884 RepID=UPI0037434105|nr:transposase [Spiractinospora alimapuensis]